MPLQLNVYAGAPPSIPHRRTSFVRRYSKAATTGRQWSAYNPSFDSWHLIVIKLVQ